MWKSLLICKVAKGGFVSLSERMSGLSQSAQDSAKSGFTALIHLTLRILTGFFLGLTLALIGQEMIGYGTFALLFFVVVTMGMILKTFSEWTIAKILVFDFICVLIATILRMYILLAP